MKNERTPTTRLAHRQICKQNISAIEISTFSIYYALLLHLLTKNISQWHVMFKNVVIIFKGSQSLF